MNKTEFIVPPEDAGKRIDVQASLMSGHTRSQIKRFLDKGLLLVNRHPAKQNYRTKSGDMITLVLPGQEQTLRPEALPVEMLFQDDHIAVVNKPPGMVVYPAAGHDSGTLMNAVAYYCAKLAAVGGPLRPGVVHRLDKDTSGVMIVALDDAAYYHLVEQFRKRTIQRQYISLVYGTLKEQQGQIAAKIGRSESDRKKMSTKTRRGKEAITTWQVIERFSGATLISARLGTGRTHQIRVHFASIGHPVLGDITYGKKTTLEVKRKKIIFPRQMLHAASLGFIHPSTSQYMEFRAELPEDMLGPLSALRA